METRDKYKDVLLAMFSDSVITEAQIDEAITIVLSNSFLSETNGSLFDNQIELMMDLLLESGDSCLMNNNEGLKHNNEEKYHNSTHASMDNPRCWSDNLEGAVGFTPVEKKGLSEEDYNSLLKIFPDICTRYLDKFIKDHQTLNCVEISEKLSKKNYVKREIDPLDLWDDLKQMLPNADPVYLRNQARILAARPIECYEAFLQNAIENDDYPSLQDYLQKEQLVRDTEIYTGKFSVTKYLEIVPNPVEVFTNPERKAILSEEGANEHDEKFALNFLYNHFLYLRMNDINKIFLMHKKHLIKSFNKLKLVPRAFRNPRKLVEQIECLNIDLLQEVAFLKNEKSIRQNIKMKNDKYRQALEEAEKFGLLSTCLCCFDDRLIPEECLFCKRNCTFCKTCIKLGAENVIGEGGTRFPCLSNCESEFDYTVLKMVLDKKVFQRLCQRKQIEEIKSANIDGLETCPFCDFSMVPAEADKIFKCENLDCMKESCRECHHIAHIPLKCSEIEYDEDVKMRTYIEDKMTEALLRTCWKCSKKFYKESGCNKMMCLCGAKMCYICGKAVDDYRHFSSSGCPLFTENQQEFHTTEILRGAGMAKTELGVDKNPDKLKFDPTKNFRQK